MKRRYENLAKAAWPAPCKSAEILCCSPTRWEAHWREEIYRRTTPPSPRNSWCAGSWNHSYLQGKKNTQRLFNTFSLVSLMHCTGPTLTVGITGIKIRIRLNFEVLRKRGGKNNYPDFLFFLLEGKKLLFFPRWILFFQKNYFYLVWSWVEKIFFCSEAHFCACCENVNKKKKSREYFVSIWHQV